MEEGQFDEARDVIAEGAAIAERLDDRRLAARVRLAARRLDLRAVRARGHQSAVADTTDAIQVLTEVGDEAGLARAWRLLMIIHGTTGAYDDAAEAAKQVVAHARAAGDTRQAARGAMGYATTALLGPTPVSEALATCEGLVRDVSGDRKAESVILGVLAQLHAMSGEFDLARDLYRRAAASLADLGPSITSATLSTESSRVEALAGDYAAAERELRRDDLALETMGERYYRSTVDALSPRSSSPRASSRRARRSAARPRSWPTRTTFHRRSSGARRAPAPMRARAGPSKARHWHARPSRWPAARSTSACSAAPSSTWPASSPKPGAETKQSLPCGRPCNCSSERKTGRPSSGSAACSGSRPRSDRYARAISASP